MIRGGLRSRLILDSVRFAVITTLEHRGWFEPTVYDNPPGVRRHQPFRYIARPVDWSDDIRPNAIAISSEDISDDDLGFGGEVEDILELYIDLFAQDDSLGWQVAYDIRDSVLGKFDGAAGPQIDVYDFRQATPAPFTTVDVDLIEVDRSQGEARQWQRHWFMLHLVVLDDYDDEADRPAATVTWDAADTQAWVRIEEVEQRVP
jgi:hypothetical protein